MKQMSFEFDSPVEPKQTTQKGRILAALRLKGEVGYFDFNHSEGYATYKLDGERS